MQVLKDTIKDSILSVARNEFYENGFENTSMRQIASKAGITVGNIYRYYKNKENIFISIISPVYSKLLYYLEHSHEIINYTPGDGDIKKYLDVGAELNARFMLAYKKELIILFYGSKGSPFENSREKTMQKFAEHTLEHLKPALKDIPLSTLNIIGRATSIAYFDGMMEILKSSDDEETIILSIKTFLHLMIIGFQQIA